MLGIVTAGLAPGLALLSYFYLRDQYGSEPLSLVFKMFIFGALLVFPLMFIQYVLSAEGLFQDDFIKAFGTVGLLEEFFKWFILYYTIFQHISFDEPYDGVIYSVAVSLGFASAENIFYLLANGLQDALGRALLPVSSHALFGVIMGYYIGKAKFSPVVQKKLIILSLSVPVLLHGMYDFILMTREDWLVLMVPFMIFLWWLGLRKVKKARTLTLQHIEKQYPI
ncbi:glutamic-type intramembrane protease PrsW [Mesobacillus subterraneus]|uniref:glutamic-type intramembrane protease PrsW n=1 Tax=Mesobacillus subterraneus TaxID=285983 RepID=UPI001CFF0465|nr:glutamic-type intramembrane protease PrsW [Mesobacillus subterraneus]WLR56525.1 glutamic-type intramembrane protease PrsW [Mesobacillus subterraneus]